MQREKPETMLNARKSPNRIHCILIVLTCLIGGNAAMASDGEHVTVEQLPAPQVIHEQRRQLTEDENIDPIKTGAAGDNRTRLIWEKMKKEQAECNNCALRQPFPDDLPTQ